MPEFRQAVLYGPHEIGQETHRCYFAIAPDRKQYKRGQSAQIRTRLNAADLRRFIELASWPCSGQLYRDSKDRMICEWEDRWWDAFAANRLPNSERGRITADEIRVWRYQFGRDDRAMAIVDDLEFRLRGRAA